MARKVYGPKDKWPQLNHKDCNEQAKRASSYGWKAVDKRSHGGFVIYCPAGECEVRFDSTPKDPTGKALEARDVISSCPHNEKHNDALAAATEALEKAEQLISAVEKRLDSNALLNQAVVGELMGLLDRAEELENEALEIISNFEDFGEGEAESESGWMERARKYLSEARGKLQPMRTQRPVRPDVKEAWGRYMEIKVRLERTKSRSRDRFEEEEKR